MDEGFLLNVISGLSQALIPLIDAAKTTETFSSLLEDLGWAPEADADLTGAMKAISGTSEAIQRLADDVADEADTATLTSDIVSIGAQFASLADLRTQDFSGYPFNNGNFWRALPEDLFAILLYRYLEQYFPRLFGVLRILGVLSQETREADSTTGRAEYEALSTDWPQAARILVSPQEWFSSTYGWGTSFDHVKFVEALAPLFAGLGAVAASYPPRSAIADLYVASDNPDRGKLQQLIIAPDELSAGADGNAAFAKLALLILPIPPSDSMSESPTGLLLWPSATGAARGSYDLGAGITLLLDADLETSPFRVAVYPGEAALTSAGSSVGAEIRADVTPEQPVIVMGSTDGIRLELVRGHFGLRIDGSPSSFEIELEAAADELRAVFSLANADGFLRGLLGIENMEVAFDAAVRWSNSSGLQFSGGPGLRFQIPTNLTIGKVLSLSEIIVELGQGGSADAAAFSLAMIGSLALGPVLVVIEGLGVEAQIATASLAAPGNLGTVDVSLALRPPDGLGVALDMGIISGGGYLSFDSDERQYAGILELVIANFSLQAIGLVTTELSAGIDGWSMLFIISTKFTPAPLGFGFFLEGVGGLGGYDRSVDVDVLQSGIKEHTLDSILFPEDPIADASQILSDIAPVFPATTDQYVFGPMAKILWPGFNLLDIDLAVVIEAPDPFRVLVLGQIAAALPDADNPIIELHLDVLGVIDLDSGTLEIAASLYDSRVAMFALQGNMYARLGWVGQPVFVYSVGGLHPNYDAPVGFPVMERVGVSLDTDNPRITLEGYFAITSNSVQFGALLDLYATMLKISIEGSVQFDAIMVLSPFGFNVELAISLDVRAGSFTLAGVDLALSLSGAEPWEVHGEATFKLLGLSHTFPIDLTLPPGGSPSKATSTNVGRMVSERMADTQSWSTIVPEAADPGVIFVERTDQSVIVHPAGVVQVRQTVVPLGTEIDNYAGSTIEGSHRFDLSLTKLGDSAPDEGTSSAIEDWFAPGQYYDLSDDEKLESPDYELMQAGLELGADLFDLVEGLDCKFGYESIVYASGAPLDPYTHYMSGETLIAFSRSSATARARASARGATRFAGTKQTFGIVDTPWTVAGTEDLVVADDSLGATTFIEALRAVKSNGIAGNRQVVPAHEARLRM